VVDQKRLLCRYGDVCPCCDALLPLGDLGWMVLIAAEIMSQSPGLGQFVWEEYNNNGPTSLARILAAVLVIGVIGFLLDRMMYTLQAMFTFSDKR